MLSTFDGDELMSIISRLRRILRAELNSTFRQKPSSRRKDIERNKSPREDDVESGCEPEPYYGDQELRYYRALELQPGASFSEIRFPRKK